MNDVKLHYIEVINETEQLFIFSTEFDGEVYAQATYVNMAQSVAVQDSIFRRDINSLVNMSAKDAKAARKN